VTNDLCIGNISVSFVPIEAANASPPKDPKKCEVLNTPKVLSPPINPALSKDIVIASKSLAPDDG
jgi:hypothetical protein